MDARAPRESYLAPAEPAGGGDPGRLGPVGIIGAIGSRRGIAASGNTGKQEERRRGNAGRKGVWHSPDQGSRVVPSGLHGEVLTSFARPSSLSAAAAPPRPVPSHAPEPRLAPALLGPWLWAFSSSSLRWPRNPAPGPGSTPLLPLWLQSPVPRTLKPDTPLASHWSFASLVGFALLGVWEPVSAASLGL